MAFSFYGCRIAKNAREAVRADREVQQSVKGVTGLLQLALPPPGPQSITAKDARTAKETKDAKEEKSFTAKGTVIRTRSKPEGREGTAPKVAYR